METEWTAPKNIEEELNFGDTMDVWLAALTGSDEKNKVQDEIRKRIAV